MFLFEEPWRPFHSLMNIGAHTILYIMRNVQAKPSEKFILVKLTYQ